MMLAIGVLYTESFLRQHFLYPNLMSFYSEWVLNSVKYITPPIENDNLVFHIYYVCNVRLCQLIAGYLKKIALII